MFLTNSVTYDLAAVFVALLVGIIAYFKWNFTYWDRKGVTTVASPSIPFGNMSELMFRKKNFGIIWKDYYRKLKEKDLPFGGAYFFLSKFLLPVDITLVKNIMQKDFQHFVNHGFYVDEENDPLTGHLFSLEDTKWKNLRVKLTPTFTSGKMKMMFQTLADCGTMLTSHLDQASYKNTALDVKDILGRFTTDIIGSCAFGLECNSLKDPDSEFRKYGKLIFHNDLGDLIRSFAQMMMPPYILKKLNLKMIKPEVTSFFTDIVSKTVEYREKNNIFRKDFMHLLIQLKNLGKLTDDGKLTEDDGKRREIGLNMKELAAQAFVFFAAGFETSSTAMSFALYEIALNSEIQSKMREEIRSVLKKHDNKVTYEAVLEMQYMDKVLHETLRKYPPLPMIPRVCTKDYLIPGTSVTIEQGTKVAIPVMAIHHDNEYYPNPEVFDPERFTEEKKAERPPYTWMPFGEGPRVCIGLRFGLMQSKVGLLTLLRDYQITLNRKTSIPLEYNPNGFILETQSGVWINIKKIEN